MWPRWWSQSADKGLMHPKDRRKSAGWQRESLLLREECGAAAGE
jgi:hypothetical protein